MVARAVAVGAENRPAGSALTCAARQGAAPQDTLRVRQPSPEWTACASGRIPHLLALHGHRGQGRRDGDGLPRMGCPALRPRLPRSVQPAQESRRAPTGTLTVCRVIPGRRTGRTQLLPGASRRRGARSERGGRPRKDSPGGLVRKGIHGRKSGHSRGVRGGHVMEHGRPGGCTGEDRWADLRTRSAVRAGSAWGRRTAP